jgi:hypothetical protein
MLRMGSGPDPYPSYFGDKNRNLPHPPRRGTNPGSHPKPPEESRTEKGWEGGRMDPRETPPNPLKGGPKGDK